MRRFLRETVRAVHLMWILCIALPVIFAGSYVAGLAVFAWRALAARIHRADR